MLKPVEKIKCLQERCFECFDSNERFTELWCQEFAVRNHFTPHQFINMLTADEQFLHEMAYMLRKIQFMENYTKALPCSDKI